MPADLSLHRNWLTTCDTMAKSARVLDAHCRGLLCPPMRAHLLIPIFDDKVCKRNCENGNTPQRLELEGIQRCHSNINTCCSKNSA